MEQEIVADNDGRQKITFVGTGQITAALVAILVDSNHEFKKEAEKFRLEGKEVEALIKEKKIVDITILGNEGSPSLLAMQNGFKVYSTKHKQSITFNVLPADVLITGNVSKISPHDHIFLATKAYSYNEELAKKINPLIKKGKTTVVFGQNGVPDWFMASVGYSEVVLKSANSSHGSGFIDIIGRENVVGAVLNLACNVETGETSNPVYNEYFLATPVEKVNVPLAGVDGRDRDSVKSLQEIFDNAGIKVAPFKGSLSKEVMRKLQINAAINGICAILGKTVGQLLGDSNLYPIIFAVAHEVESVGEKYGFGNLRNDEELEARLQQSAKHYPSMERDFTFCKDLEIDAIYKALCEMGEKRNYTLNVTAKILEILEKLVQKRGKSNVAAARKMVEEDVFGAKGLVFMAKTKYRPPTPKLDTITSEASVLTVQKSNSPRLKEFEVTTQSASSGEDSSDASDHEHNSDSSSDGSIYGIEAMQDGKVKLTYEIANNPKRYARVRAGNDVGEAEKIIRSLRKLFLDEYKEGKKGLLRIHSVKVTFVSKNSFDDFSEWCKQNNLSLEEQKEKAKVVVVGGENLSQVPSPTVSPTSSQIGAPKFKKPFTGAQTTV